MKAGSYKVKPGVKPHLDSLRPKAVENLSPNSQFYNALSVLRPNARNLAS